MITNLNTPILKCYDTRGQQVYPVFMEDSHDSGLNQYAIDLAFVREGYQAWDHDGSIAFARNRIKHPAQENPVFILP